MCNNKAGASNAPFAVVRTRSGIERTGTGFMSRAKSYKGLVANALFSLTLLFSASAFAVDGSGTAARAKVDGSGSSNYVYTPTKLNISSSGDFVTLTWHLNSKSGPVVAVGTGRVSDSFVSMELFSMEPAAKVDGSGTGRKVDGSGTAARKVDGAGTGKVDGSGTGFRFSPFGRIDLVLGCDSIEGMASIQGALAAEMVIESSFDQVGLTVFQDALAGKSDPKAAIYSACRTGK